jgi:acyl-CoA thioesterase-2
VTSRSSLPPAPSPELARLLELLDLERIEVNLFRGVSPQDGRDRIFGGQVLAQALMAALRTVEQRPAHSLHAYFLRPGNPKIPILFDVARIRDGKSFATRNVIAIQSGEAIFQMAISFQTFEEGPERQLDAPNLGPPSGAVYEEEIAELRRRFDDRVERDDRRFFLPVELRNEGGLHLVSQESRPPFLRTWLRARGPLPDDDAIHQCVLAYASDFTVSTCAVRPLGLSFASGLLAASLDHAMWFHRRFRIDEWMCHVQDSPITSHARGLGRGTFYTANGVLVASCAQEGLVRIRRPAASGRSRRSSAGEKALQST